MWSLPTLPTVSESGPLRSGAPGAFFLLSCPFFWLVDTGVAVLIWLAMSAWLFACGAHYGILGVFIAELFPAQVRYSGISFSYQLAAILGGSLAPIIAVALTNWAGGASWPVATYLAVNALISLVSVYLASEKYRVSIHDQLPVERLLAGNWG
jgi:MHS family shikimate/dehydroshikimate transporter-like MFS transporter